VIFSRFPCQTFANLVKIEVAIAQGALFAVGQFSASPPAAELAIVRMMKGFLTEYCPPQWLMFYWLASYHNPSTFHKQQLPCFFVLPTGHSHSDLRLNCSRSLIYLLAVSYKLRKFRFLLPTSKWASKRAIYCHGFSTYIRRRFRFSALSAIRYHHPHTRFGNFYGIAGQRERERKGGSGGHLSSSK